MDAEPERSLLLAGSDGAIGDLAAHGLDAPRQVPHAPLVRIFGDERAQCIGGEFDLTVLEVLGQSCTFDFLWQDVLASAATGPDFG